MFTLWNGILYRKIHRVDFGYFMYTIFSYLKNTTFEHIRQSPKTEQYISRFLYSIAKQTCTAVVPATTCPYIFSESADNSSPCVCAVFLPPLAGRAWQVPLSCYESPQKSGSAFSPQYSAYSNNSG